MTIPCRACGAPLVDVEPVTPYWRDLDGVGDAYVPIGWRVTLGPGFVAKRRMPGSPHSYIRGRDPLAPSPKVRGGRPFVVTCRCGRDTEFTEDRLINLESGVLE